MITGLLCRHLRGAQKSVHEVVWWNRSLPNLSFSSHRNFSSTSDIEKAKEKLGQLTTDPGNDAKLKLYGLYKQAVIGQCNVQKPGAFDFVGRAKWNAWNSLADLSKGDAVQQYSEFVNELVGTATTSEATTTSPVADSQDLLISDTKGVRTLTLNRPNKYNAITYKMYEDLIEIFNSTGKDDSISAMVITAAGKYFTSGNDLSNFLQEGNPKDLAKSARILFQKYVDAYINFPKPLVAAVNGPAIGIGVTTLGLCDLVYCCESATFHTPFMELGQSPEACSAFLFPKIMGYAKANEVLIMGHKMTAEEACSRNLITRVFPDDEFKDKIQEVVDKLSSLPPKSMIKTKQLIRGIESSILRDVNEKECALLEERWVSDECMNAIMKFMNNR